jgi:internalin A
MKWSFAYAVLTLSILSLTTDFVAAQSIFPDKNLEAVVRKYVFEKKNNEEPIVEADVVNISTIKGTGKAIKDLTGLEKCRSLALLNLENNEIEKIDAIKDLKNIQSLNLAKNKITDIKPIAELTKLQYVHLADNQISDISIISKLTNLRSLYLSNNKIVDLKALAELAKKEEGDEKAQTPKIWSLYLDGNQIENIAPIAALKKLDSLDLRGNAVADLAPLKELTEWKFLFLENNKVADLKVLIEMGKADKEGSQRFAPFWQVFLSGNPLSDEAKKAQLEELKKVAKKAEFK